MCTVVGTQFIHDAAQMAFDRVFGQDQLKRNLLITQSLRDQFQYLDFTRTQAVRPQICLLYTSDAADE